MRSNTFVQTQSKTFFKHSECKVTLWFKHFRRKLRLQFKHIGCKARLLFKLLVCKTTLLFKHFRCKARLCSNFFGPKQNVFSTLERLLKFFELPRVERGKNFIIDFQGDGHVSMLVIVRHSYDTHAHVVCKGRLLNCSNNLDEKKVFC